MANKTIRATELSKVLQDYLTNYREDIQDDVVEVTDKVTKEAVKELKQTSPRGRRGQYAKGWSTKIQKRGKLKYHKVIWNKTDYQLTHLLEFGHRSRSGGKVDPSPKGGHIKPVEEKYKQEFVDLVMERIRRKKA